MRDPMMPLPTYTFPRHETDSRLPRETRRALRWEGVVGSLPAPARRSWLRTIFASLRGATPPGDTRAPAPLPPVQAIVPPALRAPQLAVEPVRRRDLRFEPMLAADFSLEHEHPTLLARIDPIQPPAATTPGPSDALAPDVHAPQAIEPPAGAPHAPP